MPGWPEVPLVSKPKSFACLAERLARTGTGPNRSTIWPAGATKGEGPDTDPGEEMALGVGAQVIGVHVLDRSFVHVARRDVPGGDQVAEPLRGIGVVLVVVGAHATSSAFARALQGLSQCWLKPRSQEAA
ncbi:hypothetical protein D9M68_785630 [compost metagenome]